MYASIVVRVEQPRLELHAAVLHLEGLVRPVVQVDVDRRDRTAF
jgi:hypothetical protein